jgi:hypothetical protein
MHPQQSQQLTRRPAGLKLLHQHLSIRATHSPLLLLPLLLLLLLRLLSL